jgi:hypothetical protein
MDHRPPPEAGAPAAVVVARNLTYAMAVLGLAVVAWADDLIDGYLDSGLADSLAGPDAPISRDRMESILVPTTIAGIVAGAVLWSVLAYFLTRATGWARLAVIALGAASALSVPMSFAFHSSPAFVGVRLASTALAAGAAALLLTRPARDYYRRPVPRVRPESAPTPPG